MGLGKPNMNHCYVSDGFSYFDAIPLLTYALQGPWFPCALPGGGNEHSSFYPDPLGTRSSNNYERKNNSHVSLICSQWRRMSIPGLPGDSTHYWPEQGPIDLHRRLWRVMSRGCGVWCRSLPATCPGSRSVAGGSSVPQFPLTVTVCVTEHIHREYRL